LLYTIFENKKHLTGFGFAPMAMGQSCTTKYDTHTRIHTHTTTHTPTFPHEVLNQ